MSRSNPDHVSQRGCRSRALVSSAYDSGTLRLFLVQLARTHKKDGQRSLRIGHKALARTDAFSSDVNFAMTSWSHLEPTWSSH